jgi:hypothetical protein
VLRLEQERRLAVAAAGLLAEGPVLHADLRGHHHRGAVGHGLVERECGHAQLQVAALERGVEGAGEVGVGGAPGRTAPSRGA